MEVIALNVRSNAPLQSQTLVISPNDHTASLAVSLRYFARIRKWTISVASAATGESILSNIPIVSSGEKLNDLFKQFTYKNIGSVACVAIEKAMNGIDPDADTILNYDILWGDTVA